MATIRLDVHVADLTDVLALFDQIQVFRSITGEFGAYSEITDTSDTAAVLDGTIAGPFTVVGQTLSVVKNGAAQVDVVFTGTDPLNLANVMSQINASITNLASEVPTNTNKLRLTSDTTGTGSSLLISGSAAATLGLSTTKVNGKSSRIVMSNPTTDYTFFDLDGDSTYYYKTRYFSTTTQTVSAFSDAEKGVAASIIPDASLALATIDLATGSGQPIPDRRVIFVPVGAAQQSGTIGVLPSQDRVEAITNSSGHAEVKLLQGATFRVYFEGSSFNREFVVPSSTSFDLLSTISTQPDPLSISQEPPRPIRR